MLCLNRSEKEKHKLNLNYEQQVRFTLSTGLRLLTLYAIALLNKTTSLQSVYKRERASIQLTLALQAYSTMGSAFVTTNKLIISSIKSSSKP